MEDLDREQPSESKVGASAPLVIDTSDGGEFALRRSALVHKALWLEYLTVGWNVVEGILSVLFAVAASSIALLAFGIDSFVETASGAIILWRLHAERHARDRAEVELLDRRAHKLVGLSLFLLAGYVAIEAVKDLVTGEKPEPTLAGLIITAISMAAMRWLARAKRRVAISLGSRAMEADSFQTTACWWLSLITLVGIGLNAAFGWWWADPVAALGMTYFVVSEGREAWRGEDCCENCRG